jgi:hypothetical protein
MSKNFLIAVGVGLACVAILVGGIFFMQRGAHVTVSGQILKVRTVALSDSASLVVLDFRVTNPADYEFLTRKVTAIFEDAAGNRTDGVTAAELEAQHIFQGIPVLGEKYNPTLIENDAVPPRGTLDRMVAARFEMPEAQLLGRYRFVIRITEKNRGEAFEISEKK